MGKFAVALALALMGGMACSDELTAGRLYEACNSGRDLEQTACRFYILGVVQGAGVVDSTAAGEDGRLKTKPRTRLCPPDDILQSRMVDVYRKSMATLLQAHPEEARAPAQSIVLAAMHSQFPCP